MNNIKKNLPIAYKGPASKKKAKIATGMKLIDLATKALRTELVPAFMGMLGMALGFISLSYCIDLSGKTLFRPYVVAVDKQGSVLFLENRDQDSLSSKVKASFVCEYVDRLYSVSEDKALQRRFINEIYAKTSLGSAASAFIDNFYTKANVMSYATDLQNTAIESVVSLTDNTFEVTFKLMTRHKEQTLTERYKAFVSYKRLNVTYDNLEEVRLNPLGLFVNEFNVNKIIEVAS